MTVDHLLTGCVELHAAERGTRFEALEPIRQGIQMRFSSHQKAWRPADYPPRQRVHDFQDEIRWLGIKSSPTFVRSPEGNCRAERLIRTIKENLLRLKTYSCTEDLQRALRRFKDEYNE